MPDAFQFQNAIGNALNSQWQDPQFLQSYGNYGAQFPNQSSQIGAALYSNIQPQAYLPNWAVQNLPPRLAGPGYLNGGSVGNYGGLFGQRWGNGPRALGNPYPLNGYDIHNSMMVPPADLVGGMNYNPFLRNQNGNWPWGAPGGAGGYGRQQSQGAPAMSNGGYGGGYGNNAMAPQQGGSMGGYGMGMQGFGNGYGQGMGMMPQQGMGMPMPNRMGMMQRESYGGYQPQLGMQSQQGPVASTGPADQAPQMASQQPPMPSPVAASPSPPMAAQPEIEQRPAGPAPAAMGLMSQGAFNPRAADSSFGGPDPYANGALGSSNQASQAQASGGGQVPGYGFDSAPATTDPGSMAALLAFFGGNQGNGNTIPVQQQAYLDAYRQRYPLGVPGIQNYITPNTNYLNRTP